MNNSTKITLYAIKIFFVTFIILIPKLHSESIEKNVSDVSKELMCPVCKGQTVAESNSALANDFREIIRKKLEAGESKQAILDYFISRYGESILASPPAKGIRLVVWITPLLVIVIGSFILTKFIKSNNIIVENKEPINEEKENYLKKIDDEINKLKL